MTGLHPHQRAHRERAHCERAQVPVGRYSASCQQGGAMGHDQTTALRAEARTGPGKSFGQLLRALRIGCEVLGCSGFPGPGPCKKDPGNHIFNTLPGCTAARPMGRPSGLETPMDFVGWVSLATREARGGLCPWLAKQTPFLPFLVL